MVTKRDLQNAIYRDLLDQQGGKCYICHKYPTDKRLNVDHNHATGEIRGLLCTRCNTGLGFFNDNVEWLERAIEYLKKDSYGTDYDWVKGGGSEFFKVPLKQVLKDLFGEE